MSKKTKLLIGVVLLAVIDAIIPIPFAALLFIYVIVKKPTWFSQWMADVYGS